MKLPKNLLIILGVVLTMGLLSSCDFTTRQKIESGLKEPLSVYPTKNLEDFYDKEGYRDSNFSKDDKGVWNLYTAVAKREEPEILTNEGVSLCIDRNTRKSKGYYFIKKSYDNGDDATLTQYPLTMKNGKLVLKEKNVDVSIKNKVEKFVFFVQVGKFKALKDYDSKSVHYNSQVPNYLLSYKLNKNDNNINKLRKLYNLKIGDNPKLILRGTGDAKNHSSKDNNVDFDLNNKKDRYVINYVNYEPKKRCDNW